MLLEVGEEVGEARATACMLAHPRPEQKGEHQAAERQQLQQAALAGHVAGRYHVVGIDVEHAQRKSHAQHIACLVTLKQGEPALGRQAQQGIGKEKPRFGVERGVPSKGVARNFPPIAQIPPWLHPLRHNNKQDQHRPPHYVEAEHASQLACPGEAVALVVMPIAAEQHKEQHGVAGSRQPVGKRLQALAYEGLAQREVLQPVEQVQPYHGQDGHAADDERTFLGDGKHKSCESRIGPHAVGTACCVGALGVMAKACGSGLITSALHTKDLRGTPFCNDMPRNGDCARSETRTRTGISA